MLLIVLTQEQAVGIDQAKRRPQGQPSVAELVVLEQFLGPANRLINLGLGVLALYLPLAENLVDIRVAGWRGRLGNVRRRRGLRNRGLLDRRLRRHVRGLDRGRRLRFGFLNRFCDRLGHVHGGNLHRFGLGLRLRLGLGLGLHLWSRFGLGLGPGLERANRTGRGNLIGDGLGRLRRHRRLVRSGGRFLLGGGAQGLPDRRQVIRRRPAVGRAGLVIVAHDLLKADLRLVQFTQLEQLEALLEEHLHLAALDLLIGDGLLPERLNARDNLLSLKIPQIGTVLDRLQLDNRARMVAVGGKLVAASKLGENLLAGLEGGGRLSRETLELLLVRVGQVFQVRAADVVEREFGLFEQSPIKLLSSDLQLVLGPLLHRLLPSARLAGDVAWNGTNAKTNRKYDQGGYQVQPWGRCGSGHYAPPL
ncbi:MAG TPA: hypothetical protein ENN87_11150 [Phycisphaerales bacterium]|nr:hypothetical protein [Phycisphaerales bacterium]